MAARPLRRPKPLTEMFPEARLKEITDLLGPDNPNLRSLQKLLAEERSLGQRLLEPDALIPDLPDTAAAWPAQELDPQPADESDPFPMPALIPAEADDGLPMVNAQLLVPGQVPDYQPFPVQCLPQPVRQFVVAQAESLNCDAAAVALPVLSVLASAIGGTQRIELKRGWSEPAILWTALVTDGPLSHEAIVDAAVAPLRERQAKAEQQRDELLPAYRQKLATYRYYQRRQPTGALPPAEPIAERTLSVDWSLPSLTRLLTKQAPGLLVCPQELDGWLRKTSGRTERAAIQRQAWQDLFAGRAVTIEGRTTATLTPVAVSLTGTLSADLFSQKFARQGGACELTSRLLVASPEARPQCWTDDEVDQATTDGFASVVQKLFATAEVSSGAARPGCVTLTPQARSHFAEFMTDLGARQSQMDEALFSWASHLPGQAARLALVIHWCRWASGEDLDPLVCDAVSLQRGIALARWFAYEAQRVLKQVSLSAERRDLQQLYDWMRRHAGSVTIRDVCRSNSRKYPTAEAALKAMTHLFESGLCHWVTAPSSPHGGRPTVRMEVRKRAKRPVTSHEEKVTSEERGSGTAGERTNEGSAKPSISRSSSQEASLTKETTKAAGKHHSA